MMASDSTLRAALEAGRCPDCGAAEFRPGPIGTAGQNIECRNCRARFMVARPRGPVIFAQRIASEAEGGGPWPPIVYQAADRVRITYQGKTYRGHVRLAADNGFSLVIEMDRGGPAMALVWGGEGYFSLATGIPAGLEPEGRSLQ